MKIENNKVRIIGEIGVNHDGQINKALKLIKESKKIGVDIVKFQAFISEDLVLPNTKIAKYQKKNNNKELSQLDLLKKYELGFSKIEKIISYCRKIKINYLFTAFDQKSLEFLIKKGCKSFKVASPDIVDFKMLSLLAKKKCNIFLSTGMADINEVIAATNYLIKKGLPKKKIVLFHCTSSYPAPVEDLNLQVIDLFKEKFKFKIGYSDHSQSQIVPIIAISKGCSYIEKHITLNKKSSGPDHKSSFNIQEFKKMIMNIKNTLIILGKKKKYCVKSESANKKIVRKSLVASKKIIKGDVFSEKNLTTKRPLKGISAINWEYYLNKRAKKNYEINQLINE